MNLSAEVNLGKFPEVGSLIPQTNPFRFLDEVKEYKPGFLRSQVQLTGDEYFFAGHFPGLPIMPGVLMLEACFQAAAALIRLENMSSEQEALGVVTKVENTRFKNFARPGDVLEIEVQKEEELMNACYFKGKVSCGGKIICAARFQVATVSKEEVFKH